MNQIPNNLSDVFYINFVSGPHWLHEVVGRLNQTQSSELQKRHREHWGKKESELGKLALSIEAKLSKLPTVAEAVNKDIRLLNNELTERQSDVDRCIRSRSSIILHDRDLGLRLSAEIESFLYHSRSAYELVRRFLIAFVRRILQTQFDEKALKSILEAEGITTEWIDTLHKDRNLTAHRSSLWCDLRKTGEDPRTYEVLICEIQDVENYRRLSDYTNVYTEFSRSLSKIREWLLNRIAEAEQQEGERSISSS